MAAKKTTSGIIAKRTGTGSVVLSRTFSSNWAEAKITCATNAPIFMARERIPLKICEPHLLGLDTFHLLTGRKILSLGSGWMQSGRQCRNETISLLSGAWLLVKYSQVLINAGEQRTDPRGKGGARNRGFRVIPFTSETADLYGRIKGSLRISSADAIHSACASSTGTDLISYQGQGPRRQGDSGIQFIAALDSNIL
jgi:hypothetical protein